MTMATSISELQTLLEARINSANINSTAVFEGLKDKVETVTKQSVDFLQHQMTVNEALHNKVALMTAKMEELNAKMSGAERDMTKVDEWSKTVNDSLSQQRKEYGVLRGGMDVLWNDQVAARKDIKAMENSGGGASQGPDGQHPRNKKELQFAKTGRPKEHGFGGERHKWKAFKSEVVNWASGMYPHAKAYLDWAAGATESIEGGPDNIDITDGGVVSHCLSGEALAELRGFANQFRRELYSFLTEGSEAQELVEGLDQSQGLEAWRLLEAHCKPRSGHRTVGSLRELVSPAVAASNSEVPRAIVAWEAKIKEHKAKTGSDVFADESSKMSVICMMCPGEMGTHFTQKLHDYVGAKGYQALKHDISSYADMLPGKAKRGGNSMDVDYVQVWDEWGEEHWLPTPKQEEADEEEEHKELFAFYKGKGKGKGKDGGKGGKGGWGWSPSGGKGKGKGDGGKGGGQKDKSKELCGYCGKAGHYQRECNKSQQDWDNGCWKTRAEREKERQGKGVGVLAEETPKETQMLGFEKDLGALCQEGAKTPVVGDFVVMSRGQKKNLRKGKRQQQPRLETVLEGPPGLDCKLFNFELLEEAEQSLSSLGLAAEPRVLSLSSGLTKLPITIDSGAAASVLPSGWLPEYKALETPESKAGVHYVAADGKRIPDEGGKRLNVVLENGCKRNMKFNIAKVNKALGSVGKICETGHRVVFDDINGSFIEELSAQGTPMTGTRQPLRKEHGVYVLDTWVAPPSASGRASAVEPEGSSRTSGFSRQG